MPPDKRAQRREARRRELLDAAMGIVLEEGLDSLTIAGIAKRLDSAVGALYRYFAGKEALLVALQIEAISALDDFMRAHITRVRAAVAARVPPEEAQVGALASIMATFVGYLEHARADPRRHNLVDLMISVPNPVLTDASAREVDAVVQRLLSVVAEVLRDGAACGALQEGDAQLRAHIGWALVHGLSHLRKRDRFSAPDFRTDILVPAAFDAILRGWGADPELVARARAVAAALAT